MNHTLHFSDPRSESIPHRQPTLVRGLFSLKSLIEISNFYQEGIVSGALPIL